MGRGQRAPQPSAKDLHAAAAAIMRRHADARDEHLASMPDESDVIGLLRWAPGVPVGVAPGAARTRSYIPDPKRRADVLLADLADLATLRLWLSWESDRAMLAALDAADAQGLGPTAVSRALGYDHRQHAVDLRTRLRQAVQYGIKGGQRVRAVARGQVIATQQRATRGDRVWRLALTLLNLGNGGMLPADVIASDDDFDVRDLAEQIADHARRPEGTAPPEGFEVVLRTIVHRLRDAGDLHPDAARAVADGVALLDTALATAGE